MTRSLTATVLLCDGGWGIILGGSWYQRAWKDTTAYATGFYMFNPKSTNGVLPPQSRDPAEPFFMSVADQYLVRAGMNVPVWADQGLSASVGLRLNGIPVTDVFGASDGYRRPGYTVYVEPGVTSHGATRRGGLHRAAPGVGRLEPHDRGHRRGRRRLHLPLRLGSVRLRR